MAATIWITLVISSIAVLPTLEATCFDDVEGIFAAVFTPVDGDADLCLEYVLPYAQFLKDNGVDGVIVASSTGEGPTMNLTDNERLLSAWVEAASQLNLIIISGVGGVPIPEAIKLAEYADQIGVDALLVKPEVYYKPQNAEELVYNIELIAKAANRTKVIYDDIPFYTGVNVNIEEFYDLATERIPNFGGVKSNGLGKLLVLRPKLSGEQKLFAANTIFLEPEALLGFKNYVSDVVNIFPKLVIDIIKTGRSEKDGSRDKSLSLDQRLLELYRLITEEGNRIPALKAAMEIVTGIPVGPVRPPLIPLSEDQKDRLKRRLRENDVDCNDKK